MTTVTLITAHPNPKSFTRALAHAYADGARAAGATVQRFEVTDLQFDPVLRGGFKAPMKEETDLKRVRQAFDSSAHVAWFFPTWWVGLPAALKGLIDRLFLPNVSFRYEGSGLPVGLLAGRSSRYVTTMDSPRLWYWLAHRSALAASFGRGTLSFVGFSPVRSTVITSLRHLSEPARAQWLERMESLGRADVVKAPSLPAPAEVPQLRATR